MSEQLNEPEAEIERLIALSRKANEEDFIAEGRYDKINDDGEKVKETTIQGPAETERTVELNLTKLYRPTVSTTTNVDILRIEAELHSNGNGGGNPHIPSNTDVLAQAEEVIEQDGNMPAWREYEQEATR